MFMGNTTHGIKNRIDVTRTVVTQDSAREMIWKDIENRFTADPLNGGRRKHTSALAAIVHILTKYGRGWTILRPT